MKEKNKIKRLHLKAFFGFKLTDEEIIQCIISKELEPFGKTYFDVVGEDEWYSKYEVTPEENEKWVQWSEKFIKKHSKNLLAKSRPKKEMQMINLQWGLKIKGGFEAMIEYENSKKNGKIHNKK